MQRLLSRRGTSVLLRAVVIGIGVLLGSPAHAYGWMIKHGFAKCGSCHTDPSGGETLTLMGRAEAEQLLSLGGDQSSSLHPYSQFLFGGIPEPRDIRLGGSYRHMALYSAGKDGALSDFQNFPMQADVYGSANFDWLVLGGSLGVAKGIEGSANVRGAQLNREEGLGWIVLSRSHFLGVRLDDETLVRFGRLNLPFGLRIPEHVAWVREATRTDRESDQQDGLAVSYTGGPLRLEGMAIVGNFQMYPDRYRERGYSLYAEYLLDPQSTLGISSLVTRSNEDRFTQTRHAVRQAHGVNTRLGVSRQWAIWGEADLLKETGRSVGYTALMQADYEPWRGVHFMLTGETLDQGALDGTAHAVGAGEPRFGAWASVVGYACSHLELRLDLVDRQESPLTVQAQLHLFL
jgi:hypothetical protein